MRKRNSGPALRTAAVAAAGAAALLLPAAPAIATAAGPAPEPRTELVLAVTPGRHSPGTKATLECEPAGGSHPTAQDACDKLIAVDGDFGALKPAPGLGCTDEYDPVTAVAQGTWRGEEVSFTKEFTNLCRAVVGTDLVFRLQPL
ncbi:MAG TPA: SSI family serine proteinase inhibitor [Streptomyces sp.]|uniref:SSI family serine proteinase inhibitor n=1 Tax=Streptomyces sp. TaxID=1931 RepID=UPI002D3F2BF5|nr:SSI family serine proteinase inhibitor [Streptomyces sp.]HZG04534.1 SSI family serine proteinase inhibitor [Streptomyces sp.]